MVTPIHPLEEQITGRIRTRSGWFGKQILQVEVRSQPYRDIPCRPGQGGYMRSYQGPAWKQWRDATELDVQALASKGFAGLAPGYDRDGKPTGSPQLTEWA